MSKDDQQPLEHEIQELAATIATETRLSEKQATAYIMKIALGLENSDVASILGVATGPSASSYATRAKSKIRDSDEEIRELEQEIEQWEKTKQLSKLVEDVENETIESSLQTLSDTVDEVLIDDKNLKYLVAYVDADGEEQIRTTDTHPRKINREVIRYNRIKNIEEAFK